MLAITKRPIVKSRRYGGMDVLYSVGSSCLQKPRIFSLCAWRVLLSIRWSHEQGCLIGLGVSSIESPPIRELEVTIKSHQTYMSLTDAFFK